MPGKFRRLFFSSACPAAALAAKTKIMSKYFIRFKNIFSIL
jgi:hypothetical protein